MDFEDIHNLVGGDGAAADENEEYFLMDLKATAEVRWIEKAFGLSSRWWKDHHKDVPLLEEMRKAIDGGKARKGGASRLPRRPDLVVAIQVRDRVILVKNQALGLALVSKKGEEMETLQRFLEEFEKDLTNLGGARSSDQKGEPAKDLQNLGGANSSDQEGEPPSLEAASSSARLSGQKLEVDWSSRQKRKRLDSGLSGLDDQERELVEAALVKLRQHPQCRQATWLLSRASFRVVKQGKETSEASEFFVSGRKKKSHVALERQDDQAWDVLRSSFEQSVASALDFLEKAA